MEAEQRDVIDGKLVMEAARTGDHVTVKKYLEAGGNPNIRSGQTGKYLLQAAIEGRSVVTVRLLCDSTTLPLTMDVCDYAGLTPLHYALDRRCDNMAIVNLLLIKMADCVNVVNMDGQSPLHYAIMNGHVTVACRLISQLEANVHQGDKNGQTALHYAAHWGRHEVVGCLLRAGARCDAEDTRGHTALHIALKNGHDEVADMLRASANSDDLLGDGDIPCTYTDRQRNYTYNDKMSAELFNADNVCAASEHSDGKNNIMSNTLNYFRRLESGDLSTSDEQPEVNDHLSHEATADKRQHSEDKLNIMRDEKMRVKLEYYRKLERKERITAEDKCMVEGGSLEPVHEDENVNGTEANNDDCSLRDKKWTQKLDFFRQLELRSRASRSTRHASKLMRRSSDCINSDVPLRISRVYSSDDIQCMTAGCSQESLYSSASVTNDSDEQLIDNNSFVTLRTLFEPNNQVKVSGNTNYNYRVPVKPKSCFSQSDYRQTEACLIPDITDYVSGETTLPDDSYSETNVFSMESTVRGKVPFPKWTSQPKTTNNEQDRFSRSVARRTASMVTPTKDGGQAKEPSDQIVPERPQVTEHNDNSPDTYRGSMAELEDEGSSVGFHDACLSPDSATRSPSQTRGKNKSPSPARRAPAAAVIPLPWRPNRQVSSMRQLPATSDLQITSLPVVSDNVRVSTSPERAVTWQQQDADTAAGTKTGGEAFVEAYDTDIELLRRVADVEKRLTDVARAEVKVEWVSQQVKKLQEASGQFEGRLKAMGQVYEQRVDDMTSKMAREIETRLQQCDSHQYVPLPDHHQLHQPCTDPETGAMVTALHDKLHDIELQLSNDETAVLMEWMSLMHHDQRALDLQMDVLTAKVERLESLLHGATTSLTNGHVTEEEVYKTLSPTRCASWVVERLVSVNWFPTFTKRTVYLITLPAIFALLAAAVTFMTRT